MGLMITSLHFLSVDAKQTELTSHLQVEIDQVDNPLYLNIIWHQHQPVYQDPSTGVYEQPWVYMHATNSYPWMADLHNDYPEVNASINITPSLLNQLNDYTSGAAYDRRMEIAKMPENLMSDDNKSIVLQYFFDINPQFVTGRYAYLQAKSNDFLTMAEKIEAFTDEEILDLKAMFFLRWINQEYRSLGPRGDFLLSNLDAKIDTGNNATQQFVRTDLDYVLQKGLSLAQSTVQKHVDAINQGNLEMITTPFFHPILPLLIDLNSALESPGNGELPLPVGSTFWTDDAQEQIDRGVQAYIDTYTGASPNGMWPSEQSVSKEVVPLMDNAGIKWFVSDRNVLQNSLGGSELTSEQLYRMYAVNEGGSTIGAVFRDTKLSDDIGFNYGGMDPDVAAQQFIDSIREIYDELDTNLEDYVVTLALDGENAWEHYNFDIDGDGTNEYTGNLFRQKMYQKITEAQNEGWLTTTTPTQFLNDHPVGTLPLIANLASGSWISGNLNTWIGETEENIAWDWLIDAREALVAADLAGTTVNSPAAWDALYAAEGSDWFWWYGTDQDSKRDELFDWAYKTLLRSVYELIGFTDEEIVQLNPLLSLLNKPTISGAFPGKMSGYTIDGINSTDEWELSSAINDTAVESDAIKLFRTGINEDVTDLLFLVDLNEDSNRAINDEFLAFYFNDPRAAVGDIFPIGVSREDIDNTIGYSLNFAVTYHFNDSSLNYWTNDGTGWIKSTFNLGIAAISSTIFELSIPLSFFDYTPGDFFKVSLLYTGVQNDFAPQDGPISFQVPAEVDFTVLFEMEDPKGDEWGTYPTSNELEPGYGLFDILDFKVGTDEDSFYTSIQLDEIRNPWGAPTGFSHPLIQVYIDTDRVSGSGNIQPDQNPNVMIHEDFAWEKMVRADGWLTYGLLQNESQFSVVTSVDLLNNRITIKAPLGLIGTPTEDWAYVVLVGSQDFQAFRERFQKEQLWKLGGGDDGEYDPNVIDMLVPEGVDQDEILSNWDFATQRQAKMIGVGPNVNYQADSIAPVVSITSPANNAEIKYDSNGELTVNVVFTATDNVNVDHYNLFVGNILKINNEPLVSGENSVSVTIKSSEITGNSVIIKINVYDNVNEEIANFGTSQITLVVKESKKNGISFNIGASLFGLLVIIPLFKNKGKKR